ncbi:hypothetical protein AQUCO_02000042v1 [Aquilegia coerulea]|nr:hypothetical protein AQUCO_02000042v1 [Aquilegia coerulea]
MGRGRRRGRTNKVNNPDDRISEMPDEILSFMLFLLPIEDAARTSILSRRWRYLWKTSAAYSSSFNLDVVAMRGSAYSDDIFVSFNDYRYLDYEELLSIERLKFINWVDQILKLDYRPMMDSFRLRYYIKKDSTDHINRWINMAISKRVKNFDINLSHFHTWGKCLNEELYTFPDWLFTLETGSLVKLLYLKSCIFRPLNFNCSSLVDLQLCEVLIDQTCLVSFFSNCPNLEKLFLVRCHNLLGLKISGPLLKLKYVAIINCRSLGYLDIDARNLNRLEYRGKQVNFSFLNVTQLSDVIVHLIQEDYSAAISPIKRPIHLSQFTNLKKLVLVITAYNGTLWGFIPLLHGSPFLHTLEMHWSYPFAKDSEEKGMQKPSDFPHSSLKNITVSGFKGSAHEVEFTTYLLNNATTLQKLTIFKATKYYSYEEGYYGCVAEKRKIEEGATEQVMNVLPPGVEFLLL